MDNTNGNKGPRKMTNKKYKIIYNIRKSSKNTPNSKTDRYDEKHKA